ncbi:WXG100 family type VII secretion target [Micromonospora sp. NPDC092111]|uniref:WXG100 family type VII secretion target n=1 Tax=Micromonospora sp. NPDC092111 TaxID=3364289 RepID=UPI00382B6951
MMRVFGEAIDTVATQNRRVEATLGELRGGFVASQDDWRSPAGNTFADLVREYDADAGALNELLAEILRRMRQTYHNYHEVEAKAVQNLNNTHPNNQGGR